MIWISLSPLKNPWLNNSALGVITFNWVNPVFLNNSHTLYPIAKPLESTTYELQITDENGCQETDQLNIFLSKESDIYYPNAFSPNGDGTNDYFTIFSKKSIENIQTLKIFNRWGSLVFERDNFSPNKSERV